MQTAPAPSSPLPAPGSAGHLILDPIKVAKEIDRAGLTVNDYLALRAMPCRVGALAKACNYSSAAATDHTVRLMKSGLVTQERDLHDRRLFNVSRTATGEAVLREIAEKAELGRTPAMACHALPALALTLASELSLGEWFVWIIVMALCFGIYGHAQVKAGQRRADRYRKPKDATGAKATHITKAE